MTSIELLLWGIVAHLIADWFFQNHWMAQYKTNLTHPAAWVHGGIHLLFTALVFPPIAVALIVAAHMLIDTRRPLIWWRRVYRQTTTGEFAIHVAIWEDQVTHIAVIALTALLVTVR